jgi:5-formyltetrahydrofolate cyclo-ligase
MASDPSSAKRALRADLRERRQNLTSTERERATAGITANLQQLVVRIGSRSLAGNHTRPPNPDTRP